MFGVSGVSFRADPSFSTRTHPSYSFQRPCSTLYLPSFHELYGPIEAHQFGLQSLQVGLPPRPVTPPPLEYEPEQIFSNHQDDFDPTNHQDDTFDQYYHHDAFPQNEPITSVCWPRAAPDSSHEHTRFENMSSRWFAPSTPPPQQINDYNCSRDEVATTHVLNSASSSPALSCLELRTSRSCQYSVYHATPQDSCLREDLRAATIQRQISHTNHVSVSSSRSSSSAERAPITESMRSKQYLKCQTRMIPKACRLYTCSEPGCEKSFKEKGTLHRHM